MTPESRASVRTAIVMMFGVAVLAVAAYLPVLGTGFTSDDFFILSRVRALNGLEHPHAYFQLGFFDYYRPLVFLSHAMDWEVWGLDPVGYHLRSLMLHAGCSVLVFALGRRLLSMPMAAVAAALFALHPASHEAVYWMAARFDLMASFFALVSVLCLSDDRVMWRGFGVLAFALALLSKESAIAVVIIAPAWDVFVARRPLRDVLRRLWPLIAVVAIYAIVRSLGAELEAAGGARRLPKAIMALALLVAILAAANRSRGSLSGDASNRPWLYVAAAGLVGLALLYWPATSHVTSGVFGFAAYVAFHFVSPIVFPSPPAWVFTPIAWQDALIGLAIVLVVLGALLRFRHTIARHSELLFLLVFIVAALLPVSSMTGGLRYLYLATAGVTLVAGWGVDHLSRRGRLIAAVAITAIVVISLTQLMQAGRRWRAGSEMQRAGVTLMAGAIRPCGTRDVVLLTTPSGVGGVYANFLYESFDVLANCSPKSFKTLLRVVGSDAHVDVKTMGDGRIELRVPDYHGNIMASTDLSTFREVITPGRVLKIDTPIGLVETFPEGSAQVFQIALNPAARDAAQFYYSDAAIHAAATR